MKTIILTPIAVLSVLLLFACTNENEQPASVAANAQVAFKNSTVVIDNKSNPYDEAGMTYRDLLDAYKAYSSTPASYSDLINTINTLTNAPGFTLNAEARQLLQGCADSPYTALNGLIENSSLSPEAQAILSDFISDYDKFSGEPFNAAYGEIVALENTTLTSTLPPDDQRVILTVASITRYSLYHSCCEDTDWEKSVGNIVAATAGALINSERSIQYTLLTSIAGLENIPVSN